MTWTSSAPSNIALIKYMGKSDKSINLPRNASLSYTLVHLQSFVELTLSNSNDDIWLPLQGENIFSIALSGNGKTKFLNHLKRIKKNFGFTQNFIVRSGNNFPSDCGLASSASSFAALTKCAVLAITQIQNIEYPSDLELANLTRQGSGSSCRSFFSPWCYWKDDVVKKISLPYSKLIHIVIIIEDEKKEVSSSNAHVRVLSSENFHGRIERAETRLNDLLDAFKNKHWQLAYEICWQEFWDMHALFETSKPPFGYMTYNTLKVLQEIREYWQQNNDGPIVTLDAGANVHLLFRQEQFSQAHEFSNKYKSDYLILSNPVNL